MSRLFIDSQVVFEINIKQCYVGQEYGTDLFLSFCFFCRHTSISSTCVCCCCCCCLFIIIIIVCVQGYPVEQVRPWPLQQRSNGTMRPSLLEMDINFERTVGKTPNKDITSAEDSWTEYKDKDKFSTL